MAGKPLLENSEGAIAKTFEVNTVAHFWTVRAFLPGMIQRNHGHVVTIASASGMVGVAGLADYAASKWGAFGFDESLRVELKRKGINGVKTTVVNPSYIDTGMFDGVKIRFPLLMPLLKPNYVADRIVQAIRRNQEVLCMPFLVNLIPLMRGAMPTWLFDEMSNFLGVNSSMDHFTGRVTAATSSSSSSSSSK